MNLEEGTQAHTGTGGEEITLVARQCFKEQKMGVGWGKRREREIQSASPAVVILW